MGHLGGQLVTTVAGRRRHAARLLVGVLGLAACAARTSPTTDIPVRIDPVLDPVMLPVAVIPMSDVPMPEAREQLVRLVDSLTGDPTFRMANWGVLIMDPEVSDTLVSINADKLFMPASNQKLITGATALEVLGPDFTWTTPVLLRGTTRSGTFRGEIVLEGSGDPTWSDALQNGDALTALTPIADALAARGIRRVVGRVVAEGDAFADAALGFGWAWDDQDFDYSAPVDELMLNENFFNVIVSAGSRVGAAATVRLRPDIGFPDVRLQATTRTSGRPANAPEPLRVSYDSTGTTLDVQGTIPLGDSVVLTRAYRHPNSAVVAALGAVLRERGIPMELTAPTAATRSATRSATRAATIDTLIVLESLPMRDVLTRMQKPSQNQLAEVLFKTMARQATGIGRADSARAVVERQLAAWGIPSEGAAIRDGSGLSRHDYLSPRTVVRVLTVMQSHPAFDAFYAALPIAGVDGTIENRMRNTPAAGNLRAKTGFVDKARSLSGYVNTTDGHQLVFAILCNNFAGSVRDVERVQDAIGAYLASVRMQDLRLAMPN